MPSDSLDPPAPPAPPAPAGPPDAARATRPSGRTLLVAGGAVTALLAVVVAGTALRPGEAGAHAMAAPHFVEEAATAGLAHVYGGDYPYVVGGGVAAFDCNDDGRQDLYLAGGSNRAASMFVNESPTAGALRFRALPDAQTDLEHVTGAHPLDVDGDGVEDLVVLRVGGNVLLHGLGGCRFERWNEALAFDGGEAFTIGFSATWEGDAHLPTLAFGNYLRLDADGQPVADAGPPTDEACSDNVFVRPTGDGARYAAPLALRPSWCALSMLFSDWDRSGRRDLRVSNDRYFYRTGQEQLWRIEPGAAPVAYTADDGWARLVVWGMGIASQDLTGDGRPEVVLTSQGDNKLQTLATDAPPGAPAYVDIALRRNATAHRPFVGDTGKQSTAWHPEFADVNNDGYPDLFISKGNVATQPDYAREDPSNLLLGQPDGTFVEGAEDAGIVRYGYGRGAALVDLNLDGLVDIVQVRRDGNVELWRNVGAGTAEAPAAMGGWLAVRISQPGSNRDAIGAWLTFRVGDRTFDRELTVGGGHASGEVGWVHLGLGEATAAQVRVTWPDGTVGPWLDLPGSAFSLVQRDRDQATPWIP